MPKIGELGDIKEGSEERKYELNSETKEQGTDKQDIHLSFENYTPLATSKQSTRSNSNASISSQSVSSQPITINVNHKLRQDYDGPIGLNLFRKDSDSVSRKDSDSYTISRKDSEGPILSSHSILSNQFDKRNSLIQESLLPITQPIHIDFNDILKFPIESTHAYSYAQLSPNSLALRLNVLKRSLEILKDRPGFIKILKDEGNDDDMGLPLKKTISNNSTFFHKKPPIFNFDNNSQEDLESDRRTSNGYNASSVALAAFFKPQIKRSDSYPVGGTIHTISESSSRVSSSSNDADLQEIIKLLDSDDDAILKNSEIANTLHDLSLTSEKDKVIKHDLLKNKLLYALATPFIENSPVLTEQASKPSPVIQQSAIALNLLNNQAPPTSSPLVPKNPNLIPSFPTTNQANRSYHASSSKRSVPQSVFTVSVDYPWNVIAANDLACLMFGVSKNAIRNLTLMDLIAPQFKDFVTTRLTRTNATLGNSTKTQKDLNDILFAGEIVAISRPDNKNLAYTSLWAKKKGKLIICMFDQIPCDAFDVNISSSRQSKLVPSYKIDSTNQISGDIDLDLKIYPNISDLSDKMSRELTDNYQKSQHNDNSKSQDIVDSDYINQTRYYTLQLHNENVPCAITSNPLNIHPENYEIKLKIHTLPYIAGMFILDPTNFTILSCNNAIAKNMFGKASVDILNNSIDVLIPKFTEIMKYGLNDIPGLNFAPGLVLPEHFFRKYDAVLKWQKEGSKNEEQLFFNSKGIEGIHRDGNSIYVDAQLRDSGNGTLVVWITYSRSSTRSMLKDLDKLSSSTSLKSMTLEHSIVSVTPKKSTPNSTVTSDVFADMKHSVSPVPDAGKDSSMHRRMNTVNHLIDLPSSFKLDPNEYAPSSAEISRANSTRKSKARTFGVPISIMNRSIGDFIAYETKGKVKLDETQKIRSISNTSILTNTDSNAGTAETEATSTKSDTPQKEQYSTYSEEEMLKLEDELLETKMDRSPQWPREVGLKRRTKKFSEFKVQKNLGEGAYGKVVLAVHQDDEVYNVIIKCIDKERILVDTWVRDRKLGTIPSEIQIMANLNVEPHPNIMRIVDFFEDRKYYYLETPIFGMPPAIDLFDYIEVKSDMSESECKFIFRQICSAIYHLHKHGIVHRDIKDENIIVDENGMIKLIDFGSAGYTKQGPFDVFVGTIDYASPEVLRGEKYEGKPQDVWALGILLYTMLYKENPFYNVDEIMEGDLRIPGVISEESIDLIKKILVRDLDNRPTITDIVEHEWLQDL